IILVRYSLWFFLFIDDLLTHVALEQDSQQYDNTKRRMWKQRAKTKHEGLVPHGEKIFLRDQFIFRIGVLGKIDSDSSKCAITNTLDIDERNPIIIINAIDNENSFEVAFQEGL
ncbi:hypothetical protein ACJX0J_031636, partial [Zea mays]